MASGAPSGPSAPPAEPSSQAGPLSWEGDRMFNIYIYDYCHKRGYVKTARELVNEADIPPDSQPPINAKQGLLFEWWSVFWVLFQAKNNGSGSEDAMLYTNHQAHQRMAAVQRVQAGQQRFPPANGMPRQPGPPPNGQIPNGVGPVGQPPLQPGGYPMGGPGAQPNGIPGPPGSQPQNMPPQLPPGQRQMGPQQRGPNGNPQFQSPTMAPSPQAQPGQSQPQNGPMGQLGRSPHMANVNRGMPPPGGPQGMGTPMQMGQQPPTQQYQGRPPSRQDTPQHSMNPGPSPSLASHPPPGTPQDRALDQQLTHELNTLPPEIVHAAKAEAGLLDKDPGTFTVEDKHRVVMTTRRIRGSKQSPSNAVAGPSNANMQPPQGQRNPQLQSQQQMQAQQQMQTQQHRGAKRNSTSPGEEHETLPHNDSSPPDRKRPRRTPNPAEQQPPMAPMGGPFPPQQGPPGGPGPNGMMRGPGPMPGQQQMSSFPGPQGMPPLGGQPGMTMQQMQGMPPMHMGNTMSPMMNHPGAPGMMGQQMQPQSQMYARDANAYRNNMHALHQKGVIQSMGPQGNDPQAHLRGAPGPPGHPGAPPHQGQPGPNNRLQAQKMGGSMLPPGQPGMSGPAKPSQPGGKDGGGNESGGPGGQPGEQPDSRGSGMGQGPPHSMNPSQAGGGPTTPASGPPSNMPTPSPSAILNMNPPRPSTASAPNPPSSNGSIEAFSSDFLSTLTGMDGGFPDFDPSMLAGSGDLDFWLQDQEATLDPMK